MSSKIPEETLKQWNNDALKEYKNCSPKQPWYDSLDPYTEGYIQAKTSSYDREQELVIQYTSKLGELASRSHLQSPMYTGVALELERLDSEQRESAKDYEIQKRDAEIVKLKEDNSRLKADNLNLRIILQKLQRDLDRDEHVDGFWMKDLFPEAQEIEELKSLINYITPYVKENVGNEFMSNRLKEWLEKAEKIK